MNDTTELDIHGSRLIDACAVDGIAMQPTNDTNFFIVDDIDSLEPQKPIIHPSDSASELLGLELGCTTTHDVDIAPSPSPSPPPHQTSSSLLGTSAPASWNTFPTIPEHAELPMQTYRTTNFSTTTNNTSSRVGVPRVASMPNLHYLTSNNASVVGSDTVPMNSINIVETTTAILENDELPFQSTTTDINQSSLGYESTTGPMRKHTTTTTANNAPYRRAGMSRSRSANDVTDLARYSVPHSEFLTPPHLRKGKGGRQPAVDPRLDPRIDPKKAKRILANRLSAAKSKLKQKSATEAVRQRVEMLRLQRESLQSEVESLSSACSMKESEQHALRMQLKAIEERLMGGSHNSMIGGGGGMYGMHQLGLVA